MPNKFWKNKTVLVTGATGLMGGWLIQSLVEDGADVVALVRDQLPAWKFAQNEAFREVAIVNGALEDAAVLRRTLAEYSVETVFHLAAQALVGVAKKDPVGTLEANVRGTWNLLEAARLTGGCGVIVASSDKAYGASEDLPYKESHPLRGLYPYDVSKSCTDLISSMYAETYGLPVAILRCGNLFGGGDMNFSRTIPGVIKATLSDERFIIRSDGKYIRDFLYVKDAALAYKLVAEKLAIDPSLAGEAFNFSMELKLTVLDIVNSVLKLMERRDLEPIIQNTATSEIREQTLDATKARTVLDWSSSYPMETALMETVDWYTRYFASDSRVAGKALVG